MILTYIGNSLQSPKLSRARSAKGALHRLMLLMLLLLTAGCESPQNPVDIQGIAFHSMAWNARLTQLPDSLQADNVQAALQQRVDEVEKALSTWRSDSEVMQFNQSPVGTWMPVSTTLYQAVEKAQKVSQMTSGAYDITVAPLVNLWGFGPKGRVDRVPDAMAIAEARAKVGWQHLHLDASKQALMRDAEVQLDLSSIGEGMAVDQMKGWLEQAGIKNYSLAVAGSLVTRGLRNDGQPWHIGIERPDASGAAERIINISNHAISTSGSYRNYFEKDGVRYSHTIDPATGYPIAHRGVSVTVIAPDDSLDDTYADALATGLNVLGPEKGYEVALQQHIPAFFIEKTDSGFREKYTPDFAPYLAPQK